MNFKTIFVLLFATVALLMTTANAALKDIISLDDFLPATGNKESAKIMKNLIDQRAFKSDAKIASTG